MQIKVKYLADVPKIKKIEKGDFIDLSIACDVEMKKGEYRLLPLGIAMEIPKGYEAIVVPRSSTYKNFKIIQSNSIGVIDNSYCGDNDEWHFPAIAMEDTRIEKGSRICQFRIQENQPEVEIVEVETLGNPDRSGIGSTGIK